MQHEFSGKRSNAICHAGKWNSDAGTVTHEEMLKSWKGIAVYLGHRR
jgi:hypothetical protein